MVLKTIGEILELQRGYDLPVDEMAGGSIPVVGSNGIVGYHDTKKSISPTITVGRSGSIGKVHYYDGETWVHNTALYVSNFKGNNPLYLYYLLKNLDFENLKSSSVVPSLNRNYVYPMKIPFVSDIKEQERIAYVLNLIDKKISLNTRMNAELEAMAKQLYDYWFVQFDFPDENGKPYKSSGGKMVYNSTLKREIPEGWEIRTLDDLTSTPKESINPFDEPNKEFRHYSIPAYDACGSYIIEKGHSIQSNKFLVRNGQILAPKLNPWYNRIIMVNNDTDGICSTEYVILEANEDFLKGFIFYVVKTESFISYCTKGSTGTSHSQRRVPPEILKNYTIPYNRNIVSKYSECVMSLINCLNSNLEQTRQLSNLRDSLLPMLMNGQVTVK